MERNADATTLSSVGAVPAVVDAVADPVQGDALDGGQGFDQAGFDAGEQIGDGGVSAAGLVGACDEHPEPALRRHPRRRLPQRRLPDARFALDYQH